jgi:hypothetical protein
MADSMGAGQDGATTQSDMTQRFNGLMAAYQRTLAENAQLKATGVGVEPSGAQDGSVQQDARQDSQQTGSQFEEGSSYTFENGEFRPFEPPSPTQHSEFSSRMAPREPTVDDLRTRLDRETGKSSAFSREWPDFTAR